jgi:hypothetical protein
MHVPLVGLGVSMNEPQAPVDQILDLGRLLGQRRAFGAVGGRCSAAHAQLLRRVHDEKLYLPLAPTWTTFCGTYLAITCRHANRLIALLKRFGPTYFEVSQLIGVSPRQYLAIEPALREHSLVVNGEVVSLIPENAPKFLDAVDQLLRQARRPRRAPRPPQTIKTRLADLASRGREVANQFVSLYNSSHSGRDRELILEAATELRIMLMQLGLD